MNCPSCGKVNKPSAKFCKFCGSPINTNYKTCSNGHNYDAKHTVCPYCPKPVTKNIPKENITSAKTVIDTVDTIQARTVLDTKTVNKDVNTINGNKEDTNVSTKKDTLPVAESRNEKPEGKINKLIGWLVSFDINPEGTDYKLYDGKLKIGKAQSNQIVLDDKEVSDEHVLIFCRDGKILLQDELSAGGTFVNGKKIDSRIQLKDNDELKVGKTSFKVKII